MQQTQQDIRGNLIGFLNQAKTPDDQRPVFSGKISLPGNPAERGLALWAYTSKTSGETLLSGKAGESPTAQIDKLIKPATAPDVGKAINPDTSIKVGQNGEKALIIDPHSVVLFSNKQKDLENPARPDFYGYYNPGAGEPLMKLAVWAKTDRYGKAMLTGNVQKDEPKPVKDMEKDQAEERHQREEKDQAQTVDRKRRRSMAM
jgi:hypothetical protein